MERGRAVAAPPPSEVSDSLKTSKLNPSRMAVSLKDVDPAFQGAGQKARPNTQDFKVLPTRESTYAYLGQLFLNNPHSGLEIWRIENFCPVLMESSSHGKFFTGDSYVILKTTALKNGSLQHDIHYWLGKDTSQVPFARSSLNHDDIFILDTTSKIFQFNGSNSSIQERAKALEVVQYLKDTYHEGKCEVAAVEDGKMMADADAGEFWGYFGGFAPLPRKVASEGDRKAYSSYMKLLCVDKGQTSPVEAESLTRKLLDTYKCYLLDCGAEIYLWMGRSTSLAQRKAASSAADELLLEPPRPHACVIRIIEGFETVTFRSKFDQWPQKNDAVVSEESRGKVAAFLKRQGLNVKGLDKASPVHDEPQPYIDCTGNLQVWRINGKDKNLLSSSDQCKFFSGDCYIFQYAYPGEIKDENLIGTWLGKKSNEEERTSAISLANKLVENLKSQAVLARFYEGKEPIQFFSIFQHLIVFKGGVSSGYKNFVEENSFVDDTYSEEGIALFRVQGSGPENMQAIQVEPVASSLNSSYCYILHSGNTVFTWSGSLTTSVDQELVERLLDLIKPNVQPKTQKEGTEIDQFWSILGGKSEFPSQKIGKEPENDPHLFSCSFLKGRKLEVTEIFNFTQDDLMTEDMFILDCHSDIYVWVGQHLDPKLRQQALSIAETFIEKDFLMENLSRELPLSIIVEGCEPPFFTRFFNWDYAKSAIHGNSFQRKLTVVKNGATLSEKPKRRTPTSHIGRSTVPDKSQRSSRSMSFSPERVRVRGRSPAFNALAANFENPNSRNLSTPPAQRKPSPKPVLLDSAKVAPKSSAISSISASFERPKETMIPKSIIPKSLKVSPENNKPKLEVNAKGSITPLSSKIDTPTKDAKESEAENEVGLLIFPYERLKTTSADPAKDIDVTKRETYLSSVEFKEKFGMTKESFYNLAKWKQNRLKIALQLF
ncbi:hypothetical protein ZIOFF_030401 [Zingiber officinale]|uniref:HP domain-containing protein n=1 Tax=Zingiber officinale TaxID=94328 RepID=A0A8J5GY20_ZINOF|nr:hypothetical protein ZIOFF_030401 [Zingiber officinale]